MSLLIHNLKIAVRNLMKYKLQTVISVLSIAIGIVTLAFAHSAAEGAKLPSLYHQSYYDRAYEVWFDSLNLAPDAVAEWADVTFDLIRAVKQDGGLKCAEKISVPNTITFGNQFEFHFRDSSVQKIMIDYTAIDPEHLTYHGIRSAITGEKIKTLKAGEAIVSKTFASMVLGVDDPADALQAYTNNLLTTQVTIVDVCEDFSQFDILLSNSKLYISYGPIEGDRCGTNIQNHAFFINMVLKEGCSEQQLIDEVNSRIKPLGLKATFYKESEKSNVENAIAISSLIHLIGSLILIAAIIGFLRMQIQLFWSRRREVSLRIVNGARRRHLFCLFMAEVVIIIGLSIVTAMLMGIWIENFMLTKFGGTIDGGDIPIHNLIHYSWQTGIILLVISGIAIWIALHRICKAEQGLAANMRRSRNHVFRNIMLGLQIAISITFVSGTLIAVNWTDKMLSAYHVPEDESFYEECILFNGYLAEHPEELIEEVKRLPDIDYMQNAFLATFEVPSIKNDEEAMEALRGRCYQNFLCISDTSQLSFYNIKVKWIKRNVDTSECLLLDEGLYQQLKDLGVVTGGTLETNNFDGMPVALPIAGTISGVPYEQGIVSVFIHPNNKDRTYDFVIVPKPGRYASLMRNVEETIQRLEPQVKSDNIAKNYVEHHNDVAFIRSIHIVAWILGVVAIIICAMSIYSTIALDTRSRKKEVAIRKVHGALSRDIYRLFGHIYIILIILSLLIAIPGALFFNNMMNEILPDSVKGTLTPTIPCILGSLIVIILITLIVSWHIRKVMKVECEELIAKE